MKYIICLMLFLLSSCASLDWEIINTKGERSEMDSRYNTYEQQLRQMCTTHPEWECDKFPYLYKR